MECVAYSSIRKIDKLLYVIRKAVICQLINLMPGGIVTFKLSIFDNVDLQGEGEKIVIVIMIEVSSPYLNTLL